MQGKDITGLLTDNDIGYRLSLSSSWVRKQRHLRKYDHEHVLTIDPVMIGKNPRYLPDDFESWINTKLEGGTTQ
jgi:hypothetical protein